MLDRLQRYTRLHYQVSCWRGSVLTRLYVPRPTGFSGASPTSEDDASTSTVPLSCCFRPRTASRRTTMYDS